jgi:hypothetical protein
VEGSRSTTDAITGNGTYSLSPSTSTNTERFDQPGTNARRSSSSSRRPSPAGYGRLTQRFMVIDPRAATARVLDLRPCVTATRGRSHVHPRSPRTEMSGCSGSGARHWRSFRADRVSSPQRMSSARRLSIAMVTAVSACAEAALSVLLPRHPVAVGTP